MASAHDVANAQAEADKARSNAQAYGGRVEEYGSESDSGLATLLAAEAVCAELRAVAVLIEYALASLGSRG